MRPTRAREAAERRIEPGDRVVVRDWHGDFLMRRALTAPQMGHKFMVVWVCTEAEWKLAKKESRKPESVPWPANAVDLARKAS